MRWGWEEGPLEPGLTAIVRVKNEARALPWTLPPLLRAADHVTLIDNGSTDGTAQVAREIAEEAGTELEMASYPFAVARCGAEHLSTPEASIHSLAYFYNWSFAHVRTTYALKWDGDMVLSDLAVAGAARPGVAARGRRARRARAAARPLRRRRPARLRRHGAAQLRAVGVAEPARASASSRRSSGSCRCSRPGSRA